MRYQLLTVAVLSFGLVTATVSSQAGDAYDPYDPGPRYGSDEGGAYGGTGPLKYPPSSSRYDGRYDGRDEGRRDRSRAYDHSGRYCLTRQRIRKKLRNAGYYDIQWRKARRSTIKFHAWHDDGRLYRILVDRCNGAVVRSHVLENGGGPRDYRDRYLRPYQSSHARPHRRDYRVY